MVSQRLGRKIYGMCLRQAEKSPTEELHEQGNIYFNYYSEKDWGGSLLPKPFAVDFKKFSIAEFRYFSSDNRHRHREFLLSRGVFVPNCRSISITEAIHRIVWKELGT